MNAKSEQQLNAEITELRYKLSEANDVIEAIRTGQIDALVLDNGKGHELYTLKTADQSYRVFIEKMIEGAITINKEGTILYANSRFAEMVQHPLSHVIGICFRDFIREDYHHHYEHIMKFSWKKDLKEEICLKTASGEMAVQLSITAIELDSIPILSIFLTDLTMQKQHQKQLEENNRMLSELNTALELSNNDLMQFASVASHDLQEPLRKIQIFSKLLKDNKGDLTNIDYQNYIQKIIESAGRMRILIVDVLNYSRLSANDNFYEKVDLNQTVKEVLEDFELMIKDKSAVITCGPLPTIEGIIGQVRQVFQNIISNALKFSKKDEIPTINITGKIVAEKSFDSPESKKGKYCIISIKDNGIGFEEKYHSSVFAIFERLNSKESYEGTGIGMAITKKIMEKHDGLVTAQSQLGVGSDFMLLFPLTQETQN